jgi:hypothetical protein
MTSSALASIAEYAASLRDPEPAVRRPRITYRALAAALAKLDATPRGSVTAAGESVQGAPLWRVEIAPPEPETEGCVLVVAGLHAMEHAGVATALSLARRAAGDGSPWRRQRLICLPLANPDGFRAVERDLAVGRRTFHRQNARGVDLNRNFPVSYRGRSFWHRAVPKLFAAGDGPLSEPEARAVDAAAARYRPRYAVSLHTFGDWIFLPYAGERRRAPDYLRLRRIARGMAERQPGRGYKVAQVGRLAPLFVARGAEIDHVYESYGALSFLLEIGGGPRLLEPRNWLLPYAWYNAPTGRFERDVERAVAAVEYLAELPA